MVVEVRLCKASLVRSIFNSTMDDCKEGGGVTRNQWGKGKGKPRDREESATTERWQGLRVGWSHGDTIDKSKIHFLSYNK